MKNTWIIENCIPQAFIVIKSGINFWTDLAMLWGQVARDLNSFVWISDEFKERCEEFLQKKKISPEAYMA